MSIYKPFSHQHVPEIKQSLKQLQNSFNAEIDFIPYRGDFPRGIFATLVVKCKVELEELVKMYQDYYAEDSDVYKRQFLSCTAADNVCTDAVDGSIEVVKSIVYTIQGVATNDFAEQIHSRVVHDGYVV